MPNIYRSNYDNENRSFKKPPPKKKKKDFKTLKNNTLKSLNDVEFFLNNWAEFAKYAKIYKLFKKR